MRRIWLSNFSVVTIAGTVGTAASRDGVGAGGAAGALFLNPFAVAADGAGGVVIIDGNSVRRLSLGNLSVITLAGNASAAGYVDGAVATARFSSPAAVAVNKATGDVFVADAGNHVIRRVSPGGLVTTLAGRASSGYIEAVGVAAAFNAPSALAFDALSGSLVVADRNNYVLRRVSVSTGAVTTLNAGLKGTAGNVAGLARAARLGYVPALAFNAQGALYLADYDYSSVRLVAPALALPVCEAAAAWRHAAASSPCPSARPRRAARTRAPRARPLEAVTQ
jgi:hypothetical protein